MFLEVFCNIWVSLKVNLKASINRLDTTPVILLKYSKLPPMVSSQSLLASWPRFGRSGWAAWPGKETRMKGAEALVQMLLEYKVEVVFGVPGDTSLPLYEALYDAIPKIRHIMARDERSAGFMADAYARIAYKPGICECPSGAGALYSVPGVAEANASSIPVILFTSDISLADEGKGAITALDHHKLFEPITKWSSFLKQTDKIPETIRRAFRVATTGRPGAVHLSFPHEVLIGELPQAKQMIFAEYECIDYPAYRTRGSRKILEEAAGYLLKATRPVIIAGGGANHSQASREIIALSEWLAAPVVTTISGQGIMPDDHPLALGVVGDNGFHPYANQAVEESDLLLYVGCKRGSVSTIRWTLPSYQPTRKIIQIDLDPLQLLQQLFQHPGRGRRCEDSSSRTSSIYS